LTSSGSATSRTGAERLVLAAAFALLLGAGASGARAQGTRTPVEFELSRSVQQTLVRTQELWLQWVGATLQDNRLRAEEALRGLSVSAREIGFAHFPDLALGALAQARQSAASGNFARARLQLAAAEVLDPGRPETRFAEAAIERADGNWFAAAAASVRGVGLSFVSPSGGQLVASLFVWLLLVLLVAAAVSIAMLAGKHGARALKLLHRALSPPLPDWVTTGLLIFLVGAPLAAPHGLYWWLLLASVLAWAFATSSQRIVIVLAWLLTLAVPYVADQAQRRQALAHTPPMRAFEAFEQGRIYGGFFADLQVMRNALPESKAALEMVADVHRTLGQWDVARSLYRRILYDEPDNLPVLLNLGAYYFRKGDYATANAYFERATRNAEPSAAAWYNLSQGYSDAYMFDESRDALGHAREIDGSAVDAWIATSNPDRVLTFNGSLARRREIEESLIEAWSGNDQSTGGRRRELLPALVAALMAALLAAGFDQLRHRVSWGAGEPEPKQLQGRLGRRVRRLLPMVEANEAGDGLRSWGHLILVAACLLASRMFELLGDPWLTGWSGPAVMGWLGVVGLAAYLLVHARDAWVVEES